jgi:hypothetical protein
MLADTPGIIAYDVILEGDVAIVLYDPLAANLEDLKRAVARAGYRVGSVHELEK